MHNILPQAKEGDLSPHFNEETFIWILFIDGPISIDMFVLVKKLSTGLIWDPICCEARSSAPIPPFTAVPMCTASKHMFFLMAVRRYCFFFLISEVIQTKIIKEKCPGVIILHMRYIFLCFAWLPNGAEIETYPKIAKENPRA